MQEHELRHCFGHFNARSPNCWNHTIPCHNWLPTGPSLHSTKLNLDENSSNNDKFFGEAHGNHVSNLAELSINTIGTESEEKSELNSNHWSSETHEHSDDPDHLLPSNLAQLELEPQRKSCHNVVSSEHINPKMGHLKRVHLAADSKQSTKSKDWTKVTLQHPQACNHRLQDQANTCNVVWDSGASVCITNVKKDFI